MSEPGLTNDRDKSHRGSPDTVGLTDADRRKLAAMARHGAAAARESPDEPDPEPEPEPDPEPTLPPRVPPAHRALAEELRHRDGVETAEASGAGVTVRLADGAHVPPWFVEKAAIEGIDLRTPHGSLGGYDGVDCRRWREWAGLTPAELADRLGVDRRTVVRFERGERPVTPTRAARVRRACREVRDD